MQQLSKAQLIVYIDNLIHCCLKAQPFSHRVGVCPDRLAVIEKFLLSYKEKRWSPYGQLAGEATTPSPARGQVGIMEDDEL
jgi:hypothetical protein